MARVRKSVEQWEDFNKEGGSVDRSKPLRETIWFYLMKFTMHMPYHPAIHPSHVPQRNLAHVQECFLQHFVTAKNWNPKCWSRGKWQRHWGTAVQCNATLSWMLYTVTAVQCNATLLQTLYTATAVQWNATLLQMLYTATAVQWNATLLRMLYTVTAIQWNATLPRTWTGLMSIHEQIHFKT